MSYKTILVHCDASPATAHRVLLAAELSWRFGSHLVGMHTCPPFEAPPLFESGTSMDGLYTVYDESMKADKAAARAIFDKAIGSKVQSIEWRSVEGYADDQLVLQARYADLVVLGQSNPRGAKGIPVPAHLPEAVAMSTGRAVLVVPYIGAPKTPGKTVMVCWNSSREAARAASDAMPFLTDAEKVVILVVDPSRATGHGSEPGADVATWLVRHGVKATVQRDIAVDGDVGATILSRAADHGADMIVMGIYGHSRVREFVLGGVSRTLLGSMTVPVLMAH